MTAYLTHARETLLRDFNQRLLRGVEGPVRFEQQLTSPVLGPVANLARPRRKLAPRNALIVLLGVINGKSGRGVVGPKKGRSSSNHLCGGLVGIGNEMAFVSRGKLFPKRSRLKCDSLALDEESAPRLSGALRELRSPLATPVPPIVAAGHCSYARQ